MNGQNLIVASNPARKQRRSAAQKAASKRNIKKAQSARRRGTTKRRRRRNQVKTTTRQPYRYEGLYQRRSNPRRYTMKGVIDNQVIPALVGGTGAVVNDLVVNFLPFIPPEWRTGWMRHITKAAGALAISFLGNMFLDKRTADQLGAGAMTVVGYNVVRDMAAQFAPNIPLGEYLTPVGEYLDPALAGLGYYGAGLDPSTIPGAGLETAGQFTRGSPYMAASNNAGDELDAWPTGGTYDDLQY